MKKLSDIFEIWYGVNLEVVNCTETDSSGIPFVSRTSENNGIATYIQPLDDIEPNPAYTLSIAGSGSVLSAFFHEYEYYSGRDLYIAKPKVTLSRQEMLYYCSVIEANKYRYSYGRQANKTLRDILVPSPEEIPESVKKYNLDDKFNEKPLAAKNLTLETEKWKVFYMKDIFNLSLGRTIHANELEELKSRGYPYITRTAENNGMEGYIDEEFEEYLNKGGVITVGAEGFTAFYQERDFYNGNKVNIIKHSKLENKYISIFVSTLLDKEIKGRFSYGRGAVKGKLETMKLKLPVTPTGEPDWQWMENYIKSLPYSTSL